MTCRLSELAIDGYELTPAFDPDVTEYSLGTIAEDSTPRALTYTPMAEGATVRPVFVNCRYADGAITFTKTVSSMDGFDFNLGLTDGDSQRVYHISGTYQ